MKIKVISRGETEFEADPKHLAPAIREDAEAGKANGDWEVIRQMVSDCTETERSWIDHKQHAMVTEDDGTELWAGWLDGSDEPAPLDPIALGQLVKDWEAAASEQDAVADPAAAAAYVRHAVKAMALRDCARQLAETLGRQS